MCIDKAVKSASSRATVVTNENKTTRTKTRCHQCDEKAVEEWPRSDLAQKGHLFSKAGLNDRCWTLFARVPVVCGRQQCGPVLKMDAARVQASAAAQTRRQTKTERRYELTSGRISLSLTTEVFGRTRETPTPGSRHITNTAPPRRSGLHSQNKRLGTQPPRAKQAVLCFDNVEKMAMVLTKKHTRNNSSA